MDAKRINRSSADLISDLPDEILCHILSLLSTKQAAVTSVLSKRWLNLLPMVPVLDFDDSELVKLPRGARRIFAPSLLFRKFVDRLLSFRVENSLPVKRFSLKCHRTATGVTRIIRWMPTVLELGVSDLTIFIGSGISRLPFNVCMSKTLVNLRIGTKIKLIQSSSSFVSSMLKTLSLDSVATDDPKYGYKPILSAFPSLEKLQIHEAKNWCYWTGSVSSPLLKSLTYKLDDESSAPKPFVSFDTPKLVYLDYSDVVADEYKNVKLDGLVEAKLDLHLLGSQIMRKKLLNNIGSVSGDVTALFMGIKHVKILCLSPDTLEALYYRGEAIPVFNNLTCLSLGSDKPHGSPFIFWKMMSALLLNSQNLQTLVIKGLVRYFTWEGVMSWSRLDFSWNDVFNSLSSSTIKVLELIGCEGSSQEVNQIKLFLSALSNLELLKIDHKSVDDGERWRLMKDLILLPRASAKCEIRLVPCKIQASGMTKI